MMQLVVSSRQVNALVALQLDEQESQYTFEAKWSLVSEVTVENVWVVRGGKSIDFEDVNNVVVIPMHISNNLK